MSGPLTGWGGGAYPAGSGFPAEKSLTPPLVPCWQVPFFLQPLCPDERSPGQQLRGGEGSGGDGGGAGQGGGGVWEVGDDGWRGAPEGSSGNDLYNTACTAIAVPNAHSLISADPHPHAGEHGVHGGIHDEEQVW